MLSKDYPTYISEVSTHVWYGETGHLVVKVPQPDNQSFFVKLTAYDNSYPSLGESGRIELL